MTFNQASAEKNEKKVHTARLKIIWVNLEKGNPCKDIPECLADGIP